MRNTGGSISRTVWTELQFKLLSCACNPLSTMPEQVLHVRSSSPRVELTTFASRFLLHYLLAEEPKMVLHCGLDITRAACKGRFQTSVKKLVIDKKIRRDLSELEDTLLFSDTIKGKISELYNILIKEDQTSSFHLRKIWERDIGKSFEDNAWLNICNRIHFPFTSNKIKLILSLSTKPT